MRPKVVSNVLDQPKRNESSRREGRRVGADGHTGSRKCSCQTFVREGIKRREEKSLTCD